MHGAVWPCSKYANIHTSAITLNLEFEKTSHSHAVILIGYLFLNSWYISRQWSRLSFQTHTTILSCDDFYRGFPPSNLKHIVKISGEKNNNRLRKNSVCLLYNHKDTWGKMLFLIQSLIIAVCINHIRLLEVDSKYHLPTYSAFNFTAHCA